VERGNLHFDVKRKTPSGGPARTKVSMRCAGAEQFVVVMKLL